MVRHKAKLPKLKSETSLSKAEIKTQRKKPKLETIECISNGKKFKVARTIWNDIKHLQRTTTLCIPKLPFSRLVREVLIENTNINKRVEKKAVDALQEACEMYLVQLFEDSRRLAEHAKRVTVRPVDIRVVMDVKGPEDPGYY